MPGLISKKFLCLLGLALLPVFVYAQAALVNINTAGVTELKTLNGIGDVKAQAIINYRTTNGSFVVIDDIKKVSGIGEVTFLNIKNFITVGASGTTGNSSSAPTTTGSSSSPSSSSSFSSGSSAHYSSSVLSNKSPETTVALGAGRDRLGSVGSPLEFKVESNIEYFGNSIFKWNFGDGSTGGGDVLTHIYEYPGEYVVVLNASVSGRGEAVARINVKIVEPELVVTLANQERIELRNNSKQEVSLFGRVLWADGRAFAFPQDTIIKSGQSISFNSRITGLTPNSTSDTQLMVVGNTEQNKLGAKIEEEKVQQIAYLQNELALLQQALASMPRERAVSNPVITKPPVVEVENVVIPEPQVANVINAVTTVENIENKSWLQTLKSFFLRIR